ncbi:heavy-metal-associated domain-containing protein [Tenacibaculum sp. UWU-22]|uniref:heavy-metal-associated domain-containing protein n=1 Tax=Tenacibaculum sp. UWU-22 TaxID=3234187 RepID=UPI0034DAF54F
MKTHKIISVFVFAFLALTACKNTDKKTETTKEVATNNIKKTVLNISGMTCEIGCARTIQSKLSKKEGVVDAKVVFADSIATIQYDASKLNDASLIAFIDNIGDGKLYKASKATNYKASNASCKSKDKKECKGDSMKMNCTSKDKKECNGDCKKMNCTAKDKKECKGDCKKACCNTETKA